MAPQIGPKDAAIMLKNPIRLSATPVMARMALNVTPGERRYRPRNLGQHGAEAVRRDERGKAGGHQAGSGKEKEHHRRQGSHAGDRGGVVVSRVVRRCRPRYPATERTEMPPAITAPAAIPVIPPRTMSFRSRLFMPKSVPAAPAVAKKPMVINSAFRKPVRGWCCGGW